MLLNVSEFSKRPVYIILVLLRTVFQTYNLMSLRFIQVYNTEPDRIQKLIRKNMKFLSFILLRVFEPNNNHYVNKKKTF